MSTLRTEDDLRAALDTLSQGAPAVDDVLPARDAQVPSRSWPRLLAAAVVVAGVAVLAVVLTRSRGTHPAASTGYDRDLVAVLWRVESIDGQPPGAQLTMRIEPNGRFHQNFFACSGLEGRLMISAHQFVVNVVRPIIGLCPGLLHTTQAPARAAVALRHVFAGTVSWSIAGDHLTLTKAGAPTVVYVRTSPTALRQWTYHGVGISVPANWTRNAQDGCGTPVANTVIYPHTVSSCATVRRPGISSVEFGPHVPGDPEPPHVGMPATTLVDGVRTTEFDARPALTNTGPQTFVVWIPSRQVSITIIAPTRTAAARLEEQIYIP